MADPDLTNVKRIPFPLSKQFASTANQLTSKGGRAIDYAIAGIPFLSAVSQDLPYDDETADWRKEQQDTEQEPGEQSLTGWWLRSQDSWHQGGGEKFQEPRNTNTPSARFYDSSGVDCWTQNELKLLKKFFQSGETGTDASCVAVVDGDMYFGVGTTVKFVSSLGGAPTTVHTAPGETFTDVTVGSNRWYAITQSGKVFLGPRGGASTANYPLTNADTVTATPRLAWAKHRLFAIFGRRVYVVDTTAMSATPMAAKYSHPTEDWIYTDIADGPSAVYLSGHSGAESAVQRITLDPSTGDIPTLTAGVTTAILPPGERVQRIAALGGSWLGMVTNKGFRVGAIGDSGEVTYGPLFLEPDGVTTGRAIAAYGRWFYAAWQSTGNRQLVYRIDVSQEVEEGVFAYAKDVEGGTGYVRDLAVLDGRVVAAMDSGNYWYQHATELTEAGWVQFGKARYRTSEPKLFKYVSFETEPLAGSITADAITETGSESRIDSYTVEGEVLSGLGAVKSSLGPMRSMGLKLTFARSNTDATTGPILHSYTIKATPAPRPQLLITVPLQCYDKERWHGGRDWGYDGFSVERRNALRALERDGGLVLFQVFEGDSISGRECRIERMKYIQTVPTEPGESSGGIVVLQLRTMD